MGLLHRLQRLDDAFNDWLGFTRAETLGPPLGSRARQVWETWDTPQRSRVQHAAIQAKVANDPHVALVVADLIDQYQQNFYRVMGVTWLISLLVLLGAFLLFWSEYPSVFFVVAAGEPVGLAMLHLRFHRLDRSRRANLRSACTADV